MDWAGSDHRIWTGFGASLLTHLILALIVLTNGVGPTDEESAIPIKIVDKKPPQPPLPPPPEPEITPPPEPPEPEVVKRPPRRPPPKRVEKKPEPQPEHKPPPPPRGLPPAYGIKLENTVTAAPGTGIQVPVGDSLSMKPDTARKPTGKPVGTEDGEGEGEISTTPLARVKVMPRLTRDSVAEYPAKVRRLGIQGRVVLQLVVDGRGKVIRRRVIKSLHPLLDEVSLEAARSLRFKPGTLDGEPIRVKIPYTYVFVLE